MNWKAAAKELRQQRDHAIAEHTRLVLQNALQEHARRSGHEATVLADGMTSKRMGNALLRLTGIMEPGHFRVLLDGHTNIGVILHSEFERRFPAEYAKWMEEIEK